jgi:SGNH hydrolase-like domain, acetyltransferase AlgX
MTPEAPVDEQATEHASARRSVKGSWWFRLGLAALLLLPWVVGAGVAKINENRREAQFPEVDAAALLDTDTFRQTDQALKDRLALKSIVTQAIGASSVAAGQSLTDRVVTGVDGEAFSSEEFALPCKNTLETAPVDAQLKRWQSAARERGGDVFIAVAPDKSSIERDKLGAFADDLLACADDARLKAVAQWGGKPNATVMTLWDELAAQNEKYDGTAYQRGDTHWTNRGAIVFSQSVVDRFAQQAGVADTIDYSGDIVDEGTRERAGDLYRLMGAARSDLVPVVGVDRPGVKVRRTVEPGTTFRGVRTYKAFGTETDGVIPGTTLIVHDSFLDAAEKQLSPYFEKAIVMHWADLTVAVREGTLPEVDRIVFETSQRGFVERVMVALQQPQTIAAIDKSLGIDSSSK